MTGRWQGKDYHLWVVVQPRSTREGVLGLRGEEVRIGVNAPPVEGEANHALCRFLARETGLPKGRVAVISGERSRHKRVCLSGVDAGVLTAFLKKWHLSTET